MHGNADSNDFIAVAQEISGENLQAFFKGWLEDTLIPDMPEYGLYVKEYSL